MKPFLPDMNLLEVLAQVEGMTICVQILQIHLFHEYEEVFDYQDFYQS
jgi:hypothetical protein